MKNGDWNVIKRQPTYVHVHTYERRIGKTPNSLFLISSYDSLLLYLGKSNVTGAPGDANWDDGLRAKKKK